MNGVCVVVVVRSIQRIDLMLCFWRKAKRNKEKKEKKQNARRGTQTSRDTETAIIGGRPFFGSQWLVRCHPVYGILHGGDTNNKRRGDGHHTPHHARDQRYVFCDVVVVVGGICLLPGI